MGDFIIGPLFWVIAVIGPFGLVLLVRWMAKRFGRAVEPAGDEGGRRANRLALASELLPWLVVPAFLFLEWLQGRLADAGVIAPYPDPGISAFLSAIPPAVGLVLGVVALVQLTLRPGRPLDSVRARTGTVFSWWAVAFAILFGSLTQPSSESGYSGTCSDHLGDLTAALRTYAKRNGGMLPDASRWSDALRPYVEERWGFVCPKARKLKCGYAYNVNLSGRKLDDIREPDTAVAFFESNAGWNAHGGPELLVKEPRHLGGDKWGFVDGHVTRFERAKSKPGRGELRWEIPPARGRGS